MSKIKPCPFCGLVPPMPTRASVISYGYSKKDCGLTASIRCECGAFKLGKILKPTNQLACKEAAKVWNTRIEVNP